MRIDRLLEMTMLLLDRRAVTARDLADRFQVSTRTIYRDLDVLSVAGVPVFTSKGRGGGISLLDNYALSKTYLTDHERDSLIMSLKTLQATKYPEIDAIHEKISALFRNSAAGDWVHVEFSPWWRGPDQHNQFLDIKKAILECRLIRFDYVNSEYVKSRRDVEPMRLVFKSLAWYLWGHCRTRQDLRTFRISRMKSLVTSDETFERRTGAETEKDVSTEEETRWVTLRLRFQPKVLHRLYDDYDEDAIIENPDGTYEITTALPEEEWIYTHILSFGANVKVIEPEHVRTGVIERMREMLGVYGETQ